MSVFILFSFETNDFKINLMNALNIPPHILWYFSVIFTVKGKQRETIMITPNIYENSEPTTPTSIFPDNVTTRKYYRKAAHRWVLSTKFIHSAPKLSWLNTDIIETHLSDLFIVNMLFIDLLSNSYSVQ